MKPTKLLALCLAATLSVPFSTAQACVGGTSELSFEGDLKGDKAFRITTPGGDGEPARTWIDDDGFPTIMAILQSVENKKDISAYSDLFKKSLARLVEKSEEYKKDSDDQDTKTHYQAIADGAKKFLESVKDRSLEQKDIKAFYKEMSDPLYGAIVDGVFGYELIDPKTGKPDDPEQPYAPIGYFGPAVKFTQKIDGAVPRGAGGCGGYTMKMKSGKKSGGQKDADTYMVNPGQ